MNPGRGRPKTPAHDRFLASIFPVTESGCWIWMKGLVNGYGDFYPEGVRVLAHRYSWEHVNGPIPDGLYVCHHCDVRCCVNPDHLFIGTQYENLQDMIRKGRNVKKRRLKPEDALLASVLVQARGLTEAQVIAAINAGEFSAERRTAA